MSQTQNYRVIADLYMANDRGDLEAFYKDLSPDLLWKECDGFPTPGVFRTRSEIVDNVFTPLARDWSIFRFELERLVDGGECIVATGTYQGTHRATGRSFMARAAHVWRVTDGKIDRFEQFADTHPMHTASV
jgi:ketosteroid isomerase-like protein